MNPPAHRPLTDPMEDPDVVSMLAFQRGEIGAFETLVAKHTQPLLNYFFLQARDRSFAEDCTQEVWAKVFRNRDEYQPRARFRTYLFRIAKNHWIDCFRNASRRPADTGHGGADEGESAADQIEAPRPGSTGALDREEVARTLAKALLRLPEDMREVYLLGSVEGMPYAEIAATLAIPVGTVKSRMFHAIRRLQQLLGADGEVP